MACSKKVAALGLALSTSLPVVRAGCYTNFTSGMFNGDGSKFQIRPPAQQSERIPRLRYQGRDARSLRYHQHCLQPGRRLIRPSRQELRALYGMAVGAAGTVVPAHRLPGKVQWRHRRGLHEVVRRGMSLGREGCEQSSPEDGARERRRRFKDHDVGHLQ